MKPDSIRLVVRAVGPFLMLILLASCSSHPETRYGYGGPAPVTVTQVVTWSKEGVPADRIIDRMRRSGTVYRLSAEQLADLRSAGVSDRVIDYMQKTYLHAVRRDQRLRDQTYWAQGPDGYFYGGPAYWYWPDVDFGGFGGDEGEGGEGDEGGDEDGGGRR